MRRLLNTEEEIRVTAILQLGATTTEKEMCFWSIKRLPYFVPRAC
jgi:hypothetical protein